MITIREGIWKKKNSTNFNVIKNRLEDEKSIKKWARGRKINKKNRLDEEKRKKIGSREKIDKKSARRRKIGKND